MARLASHPHVKPTFSNVPTTNVKYDGASGSLKDRCHDMRLLTFQEQSAQLQWFQYKRKECELILKLADDGRVARNETFKLLKIRKQQVFIEAGKLWERNFGASPCTQVTNSLKRSIEAVSEVVSNLSPRDEDDNLLVTGIVRVEDVKILQHSFSKFG